MLKKIVRHRKAIFDVLISVFVILWIITLIFDNTETKLFGLVLSVVLGFIAYGVLRLMFKFVMPNTTYEIAKFFYCFFILSGSASCFIHIISFVMYFPCGFVPELGADIGLIIASIQSAKKELRL